MPDFPHILDAPPASGGATADFTIFVEGSTYLARDRDGILVVSSTNLKTVMDAIKASNKKFHFTAGTFDYGTIVSAGDRMTFSGLSDMVFEGEGMGITIIRNDGGSLAEDTEVWNMTDCPRTTIQDMTCIADGAPRQTSDCIDFDNSDDVLIQRVRITNSRGDGIIVDGKGTDNQCLRLTIKDCFITGCDDSGIELLATDRALVQNVHSYGNGAKGIEVNVSVLQANGNSSAARILGNFVYDNDNAGIAINGKSCVVSGNIAYNNKGDGIRIDTNHGHEDGDLSKVTTEDDSPGTLTDLDQDWRDNVHAGRLVRSLPGGETLRVASNTATVITGTSTWSADPGDNQEYDIAEEADDNIVTGNVCYDDQSSPTQDNGIRILDQDCNRTVVVGNSAHGNQSNEYTDNGTATVLGDNAGF